MVIRSVAMKLLEFPHSHFCEKARWALDHKGIAFERQSLLPGWHAVALRRIAPATTVPVLLDGAEVVQGSGEIITYLDRKYPHAPLTPAAYDERLREFEHELDRDLGETIRLMLYHRVLADGAVVRTYFMHRSPSWQRGIFALAYPIIRGRIRAKYRIDDASFADASGRFERMLERLDATVERQPFLGGETFSRVDITAASLLAFVCLPPEHPVPWKAIRDPVVAEFAVRHAGRPVLRWVSRMYREHRRGP